MEPGAIGGNSVSGGREGHDNWLSVGLMLYRLRATAMTIVSIFAGIKARKNNKARKNATSSPAPKRKSAPDANTSYRGAHDMPDTLKDTAGMARDKEIGRASCRESVCQYG